MSLEESDDLNMPDAAPVDPILEACSLPKFDMHLYKFSLAKTHVKYLVKLYGILEDLHPRVAPEGLSNVWKHADRAFSLKDSEGKARVTHLASPAERLEDIPPKTGDMMTAEIPCRKVLDDKEKRGIAEEKAAAHAADADIQADKVVTKRGVGKEDVRKNRRVRVVASVQQDSEHVSSPTLLNHAKPLETLANMEHENVDAAFVDEGHGDNEGEISGLKTQPSPTRDTDLLLETMEKPIRDKAVPEGLTDSSRMDNSHQFRDMMSNLFTHANLEFFNEGVCNESAIKRSWKLLCQSAQQHANVLIRFEALTEEHSDLVYAHDSYKDVKARYKECKKELTIVRSGYDEKASTYDQLSKNYDGVLTREKSLQERVEKLEEEKKDGEQLGTKQAERIEQLEEALRKSEADAHQLRLDRESNEYKRSLGEVFSLAIGKGFIDGTSIGCKDLDIQAILKATPNVDPASSDIFIDRYEKLFDKRYPYVDKVARH
ncbi:hypothetical protein Tco_0734266 [Tanacetum coccineum]